MNVSRNVGLGVAILAISTVLLLVVGIPSGPLPGALAAPAVLGMALGSLLVGTSVEGAPV